MLANAVPLLAPFTGLGSHQMTHSTIPNAVMEYDGEEIRLPVAGSGFSEPDCSPLPLDVLAMDAMYQSR